jgi:excinuclease ABC subunit A
MTCGDKPVLSERRAQRRRAVEGGGEVVAEGRPEKVAQEPGSYTGGYLKDLLAKSPRSESPRYGAEKRGFSAALREREVAE